MSIKLKDQNNNEIFIAGTNSEDFIDDKVLRNDKTWSSNKIVEELYPTFQKEGNPIICYPVENYPLNVKATFLPKQAGSGDPSPDNVRPISGWESVQVTRCGKNLLNDATFQSSEANGVSFTKVASGIVHVEGTATAVADSFVVKDINNLPPGKYFGVETEGTASLFVVVKKAATGTNDFYNALSGVTIEQGDEVQYYYIAVQSGNIANEDVYIFLAPGESVFTADEFEPYQGSTTTLTLPETIYGGTVDAVTGEGSNQYIFRELAIADMNNSEDFPGWKNEDWINDCKHYPSRDGNFNSLGIYGVTSIADISQGGFWNSNGTQIYTTPYQWGGKTQSQIKEAYPDLVVQFCLQLVSPEPFQATGNQPIPAVVGLNTLYTDSDSLIISGKEDIKYTINQITSNIQNINQIQEINNILLGVK